MKIKVKPEGRAGVWIPEKESVVDFIKNLEGDTVHNMLPTGGLMLGADYSKKSTIGAINRSERIAILTGDAAKGNLRHALSLITNNELSMFDIGEITRNDLYIPTEYIEE